MASFVTNRAKAEFAKGAGGAINWASSTIKITLVGTGFNGTNDNDFVGEVGSLSELSGGSFTAGYNQNMSKTLANKEVSQNETIDKALLLATSPIQWASADIGTVRGAVVYLNGTSYADSILIAFLQLASDKVTNGGNFDLQLADEGTYISNKGTIIELA